MPKEIERKFLVEPEAWKQFTKPHGKHYRQAYITGSEDVTIRVRIAESKGFLTLKGKTVGISRDEFEYEIPYDEAVAMMNSFTRAGTDKIRYKIPAGNLVWEVDEFLGANMGLFIAEIELEDESQIFDKPSWVGEEVSNDPRYYNSNLAVKPFSEWEIGLENKL